MPEESKYPDDGVFSAEAQARRIRQLLGDRRHNLLKVPVAPGQVQLWVQSPKFYLQQHVEKVIVLEKGGARSMS